MDFMLVIIAVAIFFLTIVMNGIVMIHFSDEQDKNQAWIPKLVVVRENAPVLCRAPLQCPAGQRRGAVVEETVDTADTVDTVDARTP